MMKLQIKAKNDQCESIRRAYRDIDNTIRQKNDSLAKRFKLRKYYSGYCSANLLPKFTASS